VEREQICTFAAF